MQIYVLAALAFGWIGSLGVMGWKAYEMGQGQCQLEGAQAAQRFDVRRKKFNAQINERQMTRVRGLADREEQINDEYENALDIIAVYDLQLGKKDCTIPGPIREALGKIR